MNELSSFDIFVWLIYTIFVGLYHGVTSLSPVQKHDHLNSSELTVNNIGKRSQPQQICPSMKICFVLWFTALSCYFYHSSTLLLRWRHNGRDSVSNHQPHDFYSTVYWDANQRKHQSSAPLAFVQGIHRRPVNSPHKWPVTRKMFPFDDVIMMVCVLFCFQHCVQPKNFHEPQRKVSFKTNS